VRSLIEVMRSSSWQGHVHSKDYDDAKRLRFYFVPDPDNRYRIPRTSLTRFEVLFGVFADAGERPGGTFLSRRLRTPDRSIRGADDLAAVNRMLQILWTVQAGSGA